MIKTIPAEFIGEPNLGYVILAQLSEQATNSLVNLLNGLTTELSNVLWPMPPEQLHLTLCEIIQPKLYTQVKNELFNTFWEEYGEVIKDIFSTQRKFTVSLDTIEASQQAIIVRSNDPTSFNAIRTQLLQNIQLPQETRNPPDIIHSSIARYRSEVDLSRVQEVIANRTISITEDIKEFKLLRTTITPLQEYEVLQAYKLE